MYAAMWLRGKEQLDLAKLPGVRLPRRIHGPFKEWRLFQLEVCAGLVGLKAGDHYLRLPSEFLGPPWNRLAKRLSPQPVTLELELPQLGQYSYYLQLRTLRHL